MHNLTTTAFAPAEIFSGGGSEVHQGRACKGIRRVGGSGGGPPRTPEFSKICKKLMENLQFFKKFSRKFRDFFKHFLKFYRIFGEDLDKNLELCICRWFGGRSPPPTLANLWKSE